MNAFLVRMEFPCTRDDLIREARKAGEDQVADVFVNLPDISFSGAVQVLRVVSSAGNEQAV